MFFEKRDFTNDEDHPHLRIELVNRTVRLDAQIVLADPVPTEKAGGAIITCTGVKLHSSLPCARSTIHVPGCRTSSGSTTRLPS